MLLLSKADIPMESRENLPLQKLSDLIEVTWLLKGEVRIQIFRLPEFFTLQFCIALSRALPRVCLAMMRLIYNELKGY